MQRALEGRRIAIVGATGMVGGEALKLALEHPRVAEVIAIGRRPSGRSHARLREVTHADFGDCAALVPALRGVDAALFCLGVYTGAVSADEFRRATVDYPAEFARALHAANPGAALCFLGAQGADRGGRSRIAYMRLKGEAENALLAAGLARVHLFRPGYIYPVVPRAEPSVFYRLLRRVYLLARRVKPDVGVPSDVLARAMLAVALDGTLGGARAEIEHREILALGRA